MWRNQAFFHRRRAANVFQVCIHENSIKHVSDFLLLLSTSLKGFQFFIRRLQSDESLCCPKSAERRNAMATTEESVSFFWSEIIGWSRFGGFHSLSQHSSAERELFSRALLVPPFVRSSRKDLLEICNIFIFTFCRPSLRTARVPIAFIFPFIAVNQLIGLWLCETENVLMATKTAARWL